MDIYDEEIKRLTENPEDITPSWTFSKPLFAVVGDKKDYDPVSDIISGCLTQIRGYEGMGAFINGKYNPELTMEIRKDEGIPKYGTLITSKHLERFAYWQRRIKLLEEQAH